MRWAAARSRSPTPFFGLAASCDVFSVSAFGIQQDYYLTAAKVGTDKAKLIADAADGADSVALMPGSAQGETPNPDQQKPPIPFTLWADVTGGDGDDELTTGDGIDNVNGGNNNDALTTGGAADVIAGGAGDDKIDRPGS